MMKTIKNFHFVLLASFIIGPTIPTFAQSFTTTITMVKGDVKILKNAIRPTGKVLRYYGQMYSYKKARIGRKIRPKQIILTGPNGQAKVVYANGDHFSVGAGSALVLPSKKTGTKDKGRSHLNLYYGKFRAMISKKGPRNKLTIKTRSAVAGVRGTDFFISDTGSKGTELTVLRGKVAVAKSTRRTNNTQKLLKKAVTVEKGFTAKILAEAIPPETKTEALPAQEIKEGQDIPEVKELKETIISKGAPKKILVVPATKEDLVEVQTVTHIKPEAVEPTPVKDSVKKEIENLKKKSTEAVLEDIKDDDPSLYKKLKSKDLAEAKKINTAVVANLFKQAPRAKVKEKMSEDQLKQFNKDVYEKYFNLGD